MGTIEIPAEIKYKECVVCHRPLNSTDKHYCNNCRSYMWKLREEYAKRISQLTNVYHRKLMTLLKVLPPKLAEDWNIAQSEIQMPRWVITGEEVETFRDYPLQEKETPKNNTKNNK